MSSLDDSDGSNSFTLIAQTELISLANFSWANRDRRFWLIGNFFVCSAKGFVWFSSNIVWGLSEVEKVESAV